MTKLDVVRRVTYDFNVEFEKWIGRTKQKNNMNPDNMKHYRRLRKKLFNELARMMVHLPPIKMKKGKRQYEF